MFCETLGLMTNHPRRVALYARVSTKDKRQDTDNHLAQLRQFAATQNWAIVQEYIDRAT
jgi:predicted site-specific integrase-resolvase